MEQIGELSSLIGDIYDTVLDATQWPQALKKVASFVGGPSAAVWSMDVASEASGVAHVWGFDPGYTQAYIDEYGKCDPAVTGFYFAGLGEPIAQSRLIPHNEYIQTRFHREWARPQGLVDCVHAPLEKSGTSVTLLGISRHKHDGLADDLTYRRMRLLAPHIQRAMLVAKIVERKQTEAATFAEAFDGLRAGMFLVGVDGRIVHANAAAHALLNENGALGVANGRLICCDPEADQSLRSAFTAASQGDTAVGTKAVALSLTARNGARYAAHMLPLTSGLRGRAGKSHAAVAAVFAHKVSRAMPSPPEIIAKSYRLTPMELRVLLALVEVGGTSEVAEMLGIAVTTVKTHLSHIYEKTGTRRRADLVRLATSFSNPLFD
jgi:DNA-binding CsgD family transcriptional regulator/PAS domain-containing protein